MPSLRRRRGTEDAEGFAHEEVIMEEEERDGRTIRSERGSPLTMYEEVGRCL